MRTWNVLAVCLLNTLLIAADTQPELPGGSAVRRAAERYAVPEAVDAERIAEVDRLVAAAAAAVEELPFGHGARDELRALRGKLLSLRDAASVTAPREWDAMLSALLESKHSGVDDLTGLLEAHAAVPPGEMDALAQARPRAAKLPTGSLDSAECDGNEAAGGRRLQQQQQQPQQQQQQQQQQQPPPPLEAAARRQTKLPPPVPAQERRASRAEVEPPPLPSTSRQQQQQQQQQLGAMMGSSGSAWLGGALWAWRRWLLDRPSPWERDCDCCFPECPPQYNCLLQGDGLYLACRGESLGSIVDYYWTEHPCTSAASVLALVLMAGAWLTQQALVLRAHLRVGSPAEAKGGGRGAHAAREAAVQDEEEEEDEDEDEAAVQDEDEDEDEEKEDEEEDKAAGAHARKPKAATN